MGSINSFDQAVQKILQNNYLKSILKTQKLEILSQLSGISLGENFPKKIISFWKFKFKYPRNCLW